MIKNNILITILFYFIFIIKSFGYENRIILKIDNEIVTSLDIKREIRYLNTMNPNTINIDENKIYKIAKNSLIREKIKSIELSKNFQIKEIDVTFLDQFIENSYKNLGISSKKDFVNYLNNKNLSYEDIKNKISIELAWNRLIYLKFNNKVKINNEELKRNIINNKNQVLESYYLEEILFEAKNNSELQDKYSQIQKSIKKDGFEKTAILFSISDTSKNGGRIGWVKKNSLNNKIAQELNKIKLGEYTKPIVIPGGFLILKIKDKKKEKKQDKIDLEKELSLLIKQKTNEQLNQFSIIYFKKIKKNISINEL